MGQIDSGNHGRRGLHASRVLGIVLSAVLGAVLASADDLADEPGPSTDPPGLLEFVGKNTFATAKGRFHEWRIAENGVEVDDLEESFAVVEVMLASVDTGNKRRDDHLRSPDFFETGTYPVARVRVHSLRRDGEDGMGKLLFTARFDVDLHGVTKTLDGQIVLLGLDPLVARGSLTIDRLDFGIGSPPSRWNPMSIERAVPVQFRVELPQPVE